MSLHTGSEMISARTSQLWRKVSPSVQWLGVSGDGIVGQELVIITNNIPR
jgi:hypothetical protein